MKASELIKALSQKLEVNTQTELAAALGVTVGTLINWKNKDEELSPSQVASALAKSRSVAVRKAQLETIQPIVEFYYIDGCLTKHKKALLVFDGRDEASLYAQGLKASLEKSYGIYIFYDSRGHALYVGKAREQTIWKEMNKAFNRKRDVQNITLVHHPQNKEFKLGYEKLRQPKRTQLELFDIACYFSAYSVSTGMIDDLEALLIRSFANNLLNIRMETFANMRR